ncbi:CRISPR-associated endonuclease Cas2 [Thiolapillus sp.]
MRYYLICFDVHNNRLRYRVVKELRKHGYRVQYSVFEAAFRKPSQLRQLKRRLRRLCEQYDDNGNIRFYRMNQQTLKESFALDEQPLMNYPASIVI